MMTGRLRFFCVSIFTLLGLKSPISCGESESEVIEKVVGVCDVNPSGKAELRCAASDVTKITEIRYYYNSATYKDGCYNCSVGPFESALFYQRVNKYVFYTVVKNCRDTLTSNGVCSAQINWPDNEPVCGDGITCASVHYVCQEHPDDSKKRRSEVSAEEPSKRTTCLDQCGEEFRNSGGCKCDYSCLGFGNCCDDYLPLCRPSYSIHSRECPPEVTGKLSCLGNQKQASAETTEVLFDTTSDGPVTVDTDSDTIPIGVIAGPVVGGVILVVVLVVMLICCLVKGRRSKQRTAQGSPPDNGSVVFQNRTNRVTYAEVVFDTDGTVEGADNADQMSVQYASVDRTRRQINSDVPEVEPCMATYDHIRERGSKFNKDTHYNSLQQTGRNDSVGDLPEQVYSSDSEYDRLNRRRPVNLNLGMSEDQEAGGVAEYDRLDRQQSPDARTDRETDRPIGGQTDRPTGRPTNRSYEEPCPNPTSPMYQVGSGYEYSEVVPSR